MEGGTGLGSYNFKAGGNLGSSQSKAGYAVSFVYNIIPGFGLGFFMIHSLGGVVKARISESIISVNEVHTKGTWHMYNGRNPIHVHVCIRFLPLYSGTPPCECP